MHMEAMLFCVAPFRSLTSPTCSGTTSNVVQVSAQHVEEHICVNFLLLCTVKVAGNVTHAYV